MKNNAILFITICFSVLLSSWSNDPVNQPFNGKDLSNWTIFLPDTSADPNEVFRVKDGIIKVTGLPYGYIRTKESYSDYNLHLEWRWTDLPTNSGVLLHTRGKDLLFPHCVECQLQNQQAGNIILMGKGAGLTANDTKYMVESETKRYLPVPKFEESSEKPAGEWNSYDITCDGDNIEIIVNGVLQNRASELTLSSGQISLQSEGGPIEFRNIKLTPLK